MRGIVLVSLILPATAVPAAGQMAIRIGAAYAKKGGAASGDGAGGQADRGSLSTSHLQFSLLLRARAFPTSDRRHALVVLAGPWVGSRLSCENGPEGVFRRVLGDDEARGGAGGFRLQDWLNPG